jgi:hypothetical protein
MNGAEAASGITSLPLDSRTYRIQRTATKPKKLIYGASYRLFSRCLQVGISGNHCKSRPGNHPGESVSNSRRGIRRGSRDDLSPWVSVRLPIHPKNMADRLSLQQGEKPQFVAGLRNVADDRMLNTCRGQSLIGYSVAHSANQWSRSRSNRSIRLRRGARVGLVSSRRFNANSANAWSTSSPDRAGSWAAAASGRHADDGRTLRKEFEGARRRLGERLGERIWELEPSPDAA